MNTIAILVKLKLNTNKKRMRAETASYYIAVNLFYLTLYLREELTSLKYFACQSSIIIFMNLDF